MGCHVTILQCHRDVAPGRHVRLARRDIDGEVEYTYKITDDDSEIVDACSGFASPDDALASARESCRQEMLTAAGGSELEAFIAANGGYWDGECRNHPLTDWRHEVASGDTRLGYWDWALACEEQP